MVLEAEVDTYSYIINEPGQRDVRQPLGSHSYGEADRRSTWACTSNDDSVEDRLQAMNTVGLRVHTVRGAVPVNTDTEIPHKISHS